MHRASRQLRRAVRVAPSGLAALLTLNAWRLNWRLAMRMAFPAAAYGRRKGLRALPRVVVANVVAILAARRALTPPDAGGPRQRNKTRHVFPAQLAAR